MRTTLEFRRNMDYASDDMAQAHRVTFACGSITGVFPENPS